ncbi:hypothetical protein RBI22_15200 [Alcaligenaceae bacterium C4P045]|nr:hypothetical protein [Alcaligenaceae bacterium C4P045]
MSKIVFVPVTDLPRTWAVHGDADVSVVELEDDETPVQAYMKAKGDGAPYPDLIFTKAPGPSNEWVVEGDSEIQSIVGRAGQWPTDIYDEIKPELNQPLNYRDARHASYPAVRDQLDAVAKMGIALREGKPFPDDVNAWLDTIEAVKAQHPKPDGDEE